MKEHKPRLAKGFYLMPDDYDQYSYWEGNTIEEAFKNLIIPCEFWVCDDCDRIFEDKEEAEEHEEDYKD